MNNEFMILFATAASIGFVHTISGPDHYLPFIALAKSRSWSNIKMLTIVILCGIGHILSSVLIILIGITFGITVSDIAGLENGRGNIAGWLMIAFGLIYTIWGIRKSIKNKPHSHIHEHKEGSLHIHNHRHSNEHSHVHTREKTVTPWVMFIIFIFGPCEPLIPLVMYPAATGNYLAAGIVALIFGIVTIAAMLGITFLGLYGINLLPLNKLERNMHAIAGATILICGISVTFLGL